LQLATYLLALTILTACRTETGDGDGGGGPAPVTAAPIVERFEAAPASILTGESATLSWIVRYATEVTITGGGLDKRYTDVAALGGTLQVTPGVTTTYELTAVNAPSGGVLSDAVTARVSVEVIQPATPEVALAVLPAVVAPGEEATLSWSCSDAERLALTANGEPLALPLDPIPVGRMSVTPTVDTIYVLTASGEGGAASAHAELAVRLPVGILSFSAEPAQGKPGLRTEVSWEVEYPDRVTLSWADQEVQVFPVGTRIVELQRSTAFTLTATGFRGPVKETISVRILPLEPPEIDLFVARPDTAGIDDEVNVVWDVWTADVLALTATRGGGAPVEIIDVSGLSPEAGSVVHRPGATTTYRLSAANADGEATAEATVVVPLAILELGYGAGPAGPVWPFSDVPVFYRVQGAVRAEVRVGGEAARAAEIGPDGRGVYWLKDFEGDVRVTLVAYDAAGDSVLERVEVATALPEVGAFDVAPAAPGIDDSVDLSWRVSGAKTLTLLATAEGGEPVPLFADRPQAARVEVGSRQHRPGVTTVYRLVAGNDAGSVDREVTAAVPLGVLSLVADGSPVQLGEAATVRWRVQGATRAELRLGDGPAEVAAIGPDGRGARVVEDVRATTAATLTAFDAAGGQAARAVDVELARPRVAAFSASPREAGIDDEVILSWRTEGAEAVTLTALPVGGEPEEVALGGQLEGLVRHRPRLSTTYVLTARNAAGTSQAGLQVVVPLAILDFELEDAPTRWGEDVTVRVRVQGAVRATLRVDDGAPFALDLDAEGRAEHVLPDVRSEQTLSLRAFGPGEEVVETVQRERVLGLLPPEVLLFTAAPGSGASGGTYRLAWRTLGAEEIEIDAEDSRGERVKMNVGGLDPASGVLDVVVDYSTTFTLTAVNPAGTVTEEAGVAIVEEPGPAFIDRFEAAAARVFIGEDVELTWQTRDAESLTLWVFEPGEAEPLEVHPILEADRDSATWTAEDLPADRRFVLEATGSDGEPVTAELVVRVVPDLSRLLLSEVLYDAEGADDRLEWIELHNDAPYPIGLSGVAVGWGGGSFAWQTLQLPDVEVAAGACVVVGGPDSSDANAAPEIDVPVDFEEDLQNGGGWADGVALFSANADEIDETTVPFAAVVYGDAVDPADTFTGPDGDPVAAPHVHDVPGGRSVFRVLPDDGGAGGGWGEAAPTPGRCFGLVPEDLSDGDAQVFAGRRRGPEGGGVLIGLRTFAASAEEIEVFLGAVPATCSDDPAGLLCELPAGLGQTALVLRGADGDVVYPGFFTYEPVDWCILQGPHDLQAGEGDALEVLGRLYEEGVTPAAGAAAEVEAQWGYGPSGSDPGLLPGDWTWRGAAFDRQEGNNDEYRAGPEAPAVGTYAHVFRFRLEPGGVWTYCDRDGVVNNDPASGNGFDPDEAGVLEVVE